MKLEICLFGDGVRLDYSSLRFYTVYKSTPQSITECTLNNVGLYKKQDARVAYT